MRRTASFPFFFVLSKFPEKGVGDFLSLFWRRKKEAPKDPEVSGLSVLVCGVRHLALFNPPSRSSCRKALGG